MPVEIKLEPPRQDAVIRLMDMSTNYMASLYPAESNHLVDLSTLEKDNVSFFVARNDGEIVGCCALLAVGDGTAEIKRMFVDPEARGLRIGVLMMEALVARGKALGLSAIRLETGISQPEAIGLYRKGGFVEIDAFPPYQPDPLSLFMEKQI